MGALATVLPAACASRGGGLSEAVRQGAPTERLAADRVYVIEMDGIPAGDTSVTFGAEQGRTILLQHGTPDNTIFAEVSFPAGSFADAGDSVTVTLRPRPGVYGLDVDLPSVPRRGATIRFRYPMHFAPPRAAEVQYGTRTRLEAALVIGRMLEEGMIGLLASSRPASDNLEAPLAGPGTYLLVAPK